MLMRNNSIIVLYLNNNNIGDVGAKDIADALMRNHTITELNLNDNDIGDVGAREIADALMENVKFLC